MYQSQKEKREFSKEESEETIEKKEEVSDLRSQEGHKAGLLTREQ